MREPWDVGVVGLGGIGGILAACLCRGGHRVRAVEVMAGHRQAVARDGLRIAGCREFTARPAAVLERIEELGAGPLDFLVVAVKATVLPLVAPALRALPGAVPCACFVNGIDSPAPILEALGPDRTVRAAVNFGGTLLDDGQVKWAFENPPTYLGGSTPAARAAAQRLAATFTQADLRMEAVDDIRTRVWHKAIVNALFATAYLTGLRIGEQLDLPELRALFEGILRERLAVARAVGIPLPDGFFEHCVAFHEKARAHLPSSAHDGAAGRKAEVDFIEGKFVEYGRRQGVPVPIHETLCALVKGREGRGPRA